MKILKKALSKPTLWILVAFFVIGMLPRYTSIFESSKQTTLLPLSTLLNAMPETGNSKYDKLIHENTLLKNELINKNKQISEYRNLLSNIKSLKMITDDSQYKIITAKVIMGFDLSEWRYSMAVNRGANQGVRIGYPVVVGNVLVGRVVAVGLNSCRIQLIVDPGFPGVKSIIENQQTHNANHSNKPISHGLLTGSARKSYMLSLEHIPHTDTAQKEDKIFVSNQSFMFPGGLYIGSIENIRREGDPRFFRIDVKPAIDPKSIENVQILTYKPKDLLPPETITDSVHIDN